MKKCIKCKDNKPLNKFYKYTKSKDGRQSFCKKCAGVMNKTYHNDQNKTYNSKEYRRNASLKFRQRNLEMHILSAVKSSAKKRNLKFNLTIEDIVIPEYCPYLQIKITKEAGNGCLPTNPSIDRIDNIKGYIKGNIQIISYLANRMKQNASIQDLLTFARNVIRIHEL